MLPLRAWMAMMRRCSARTHIPHRLRSAVLDLNPFFHTLISKHKHACLQPPAATGSGAGEPI